MLHLGSIRQTVQIEEILDRQAIRTGDRATIRCVSFIALSVVAKTTLMTDELHRFKFQKTSEHITVGSRFLVSFLPSPTPVPLRSFVLLVSNNSPSPTSQFREGRTKVRLSTIFSLPHPDLLSAFQCRLLPSDSY
jgi:hypothetical protein